MTARVSPSEVKEIVDTNLDDNVILTNMIDTANAYVDEHVVGQGHSDRILAKIELYLAAHFVAVTEERGGIILDRYGDSEVEYAEQVYGDGLRSTRYGQQAIILDTSGVLAGLGASKMKAQFRVV